MLIGTHIPIITLHINGFNSPIKRHRLAEWIQKQGPYICCLQEIHFRPRDKYRLESKGIEFTIDTNVEEKYIKCDKYEIERCIVNLVGNAVKFTPSGGKIDVLITDKGNTVEISVKDTGIGISEKNKKTIFNKFNQVIDSNSEVKGGSGLGLTITKHLIELHNGSIDVLSEINNGSEFIITLPADNI